VKRHGPLGVRQRRAVPLASYRLWKHVTTEQRWSDERRRKPTDLNYENISGAELGFEVLRAAETFELTVDHDRQPSTQRLTLLHAAQTAHHHDHDDNQLPQ